MDMEFEFRPQKVDPDRRSRSKSPSALIERFQLFTRKNRHKLNNNRDLTYFEEKSHKVN